jgi:hypothetical protein
MNLQTLYSALREIGISDQVLALGGRAEMCWCIEQNAEGSWEVFWLERGNRIGRIVLESEAAACNQLLGQLTYSQLLAGKIRYVGNSAD